MPAESYTLNFDGYWRQSRISGLPALSGIYCVYAGTYNRRRKTASLRKLLYIGEAANVMERVSGHEQWEMWEQYLHVGEVLYFTAALIHRRFDRERAEAAMVYKHKPPCNSRYTKSFGYDTTTVSTTGRKALLVGHFTVYRSY